MAPHACGLKLANDGHDTRSLHAMRWSVRRILDATCERVGRADTPGRVAVAAQDARESAMPD